MRDRAAIPFPRESFSFAKLCVLHNLANFTMFRRLPRILMRLGLELYLAPIPRPSSEQFVFYCGAVHTQLRAAGACLQNSTSRGG